MDEMNAFLSAHIERPRADGRGIDLRKGVRGFIKWDIKEETGYEICFWPGESESKSVVLKEIATSPVVERVLVGKEAEAAVYGDRR